VALARFFLLLLDEDGDLDPETQAKHHEETNEVCPVPRIDLIKESFLGHLRHSEFIVVVSGVAGNAADESI